MKSRRQRNRKDHSQERLLNTCAWCHTPIAEDTEVFSLSAKLKPDVDLKGAEGTVIPWTLEVIDRIVLAIVPTADSPAKKEGNDVLFLICSDDCGTALGEALNQEIGLVDDIQSR